MSYRDPPGVRPRSRSGPGPGRRSGPARAGAAQRRAARRRQGRIRLGGALAVLVVIVLVIVLLGSGGGSTPAGARSGDRTGARHSLSRAAAARARAAAARSVRVTYRPLWTLPAPLRDPATVALNGSQFVMAGGLDAADVSTSEVDLASARGMVRSGNVLPVAQHDAQAAALGGKVYVFGGGSFSELDHILAYDPATGAVSQVGRLPAAQSDAAVAQWGDSAYVVGGYDGTNYLNTVIAYRPGGAPAIVGHLPVGLRYAAVTAADGAIYIIGGSTPTGTSDAVYRFNLSTHAVARLATLPHPTTHGGAALLDGQIYLVGGRGSGDSDQYNGVWAIDPVTGRIRAGGHLPQPTSDAAVTALGHGIVVAGGLTPSGSVLSAVGELVPVSAR
jgi:N-acetylneuraminic acid mutarotase